MASKKKIWVFTNGKMGCTRQAEGLAASLNSDFETKTIRSDWYVPKSPAWLRKKILNFAEKDSKILSAPWPDIAISCGERTIPYMLHIQKESKGKTCIIYVQNPKESLSKFDYVIAMEHDKISGDNIIKTDFAIHPINEKLLDESKREFNKLLPSTPHYKNAVILGGNTKKYKMNKHQCLDLIEKIRTIYQNHRGGLFISPSRRTPALMLDLLHESFKDVPDIYIVNLQDSYNPYFGILSIVENIFVTNDSVSIISETCSTGRNTFIIPLNGFKLGKMEVFINNLIEKNIISYFNEKASKHSITDNTQRIASLLKEKMISSGKFKAEDFQ